MAPGSGGAEVNAEVIGHFLQGDVLEAVVDVTAVTAIRGSSSGPITAGTVKLVGPGKVASSGGWWG